MEMNNQFIVDGMPFDIATLPEYIDHTLLKPDALLQDIHKLCDQAIKYNFYSVCVNSSWVAECREYLDEAGVSITAVCGFPLGANGSDVKAFEAAYCVEHGASEIDMVLPVGLVIDGKNAEVILDIEKVVRATEGEAIVKVILETGYLNEEQIRKACLCAEQAGAFFVKTSTGFGPRGASLEDIRIMKKSVSEHIGIKASGGIRDLETAVQMIQAGARRLGLSSGVEIMKGIKGTEDY
jgi:deoxyribose-phosphate aldolase